MSALLKKICKRMYVPSEIEFEGLKFHDVKHTNILKNIAQYGDQAFEPEIIHFVKNYSFPFNSFMDCGANIGIFSGLVEKFHPGKKIIAFEPFPENVAYLESFKRNNGLNFEIRNVAVSDKTDTADLFIPQKKNSSRLASSASLKGGETAQTKIVKVQVEPFSKHMESLAADDYPLFIKMDIEDSELDALRSTKDILKTRKDIDLIVEILIESENNHALFDFLKSCGFDAYLVTNTGLMAEDRPVMLAKHDSPIPVNRTIWKNHFFTKRPKDEIAAFSKQHFGYFV